MRWDGADHTNNESELQLADISLAQFAAMAKKERGETKPFNVMQRYRVVGVWLWTA